MFSIFNNKFTNNNNLGQSTKSWLNNLGILIISLSVNLGDGRVYAKNSKDKQL